MMTNDKRDEILTRLDERTETLVIAMNDLGERVTLLESFKNFTNGGLAIVGFGLTLALTLVITVFERRHP